MAQKRKDRKALTVSGSSCTKRKCQWDMGTLWWSGTAFGKRSTDDLPLYIFQDVLQKHSKIAIWVDQRVSGVVTSAGPLNSVFMIFLYVGWWSLTFQQLFQAMDTINYHEISTFVHAWMVQPRSCVLYTTVGSPSENLIYNPCWLKIYSASPPVIMEVFEPT